jgi:hypothetical protein
MNVSIGGNHSSNNAEPRFNQFWSKRRCDEEMSTTHRINDTRTCVDDLDSRFLVWLVRLHHFCCLTHSNTAFDYKGDVLQNWVSKLISVLFLQNSDAL